MLTFYGSKTRGPVPVDSGSTKLPANVSWIDAFEPTGEERSRLAKVLGTRIPTLENLVEIESSSRLSVEDGTLMMSLPATVKDDTGYPKSTPVGFVVTPDCVATIRFDRLPSFEALSHQICERGDFPAGGVEAVTTLLEMMVDHIADHLERIGGELDDMSHQIFSSKLINPRASLPRRMNRLLAGMLKSIGRHGDIVSRVSQTLLGLSRMPPFIVAKAHPKLSPELKGRLDTMSADLHSLHEFQEHLANKTQFLLDSLLGLANIEQNNVFRVLTVVSVIGIPPTFVASMYGMNFKNMPELEWHYGYAWGLFLIALSAIVPAAWFKFKGWW